MNSDKITIPLTAVVLTYNEEENIVPCLRSLADWVGELIVVDSGSKDRTLELARKFTDKIYKHPFENYSKQRNWAQENLPISHPWIFQVDADERVTSELKSALVHLFNDQDQLNQAAGIMVRRRIVFMGRWIKHGGIYPTYHLRIYKKDLGRCEDRDYDQHFFVEGDTLQLDADLIEDTATALHSWTARHNRWAQKEARFLADETAKTSGDLVQPDRKGNPIERRRWVRSRILQRAPLFWRALFYFLYRYFLRGGFLDGREGLIYHVLHGFWFRFYIDACLFEIQREQVLAAEKEKV